MSKPFDRNTVGGRIATATGWTLGTIIYVAGLLTLCFQFSSHLGWIIPAYLFGTVVVVCSACWFWQVFIPWIYTGNWDGRDKMKTMMAAYGITDPRQYSATARAHEGAALKAAEESRSLCQVVGTRGQVRFP
jgi:hypothetical protein